jgi:flagellar hook-associated protein 3 FlgL
MAVQRVSDAQTFSFITERAGQLQVAIRDLQEQVSTGNKLLRLEQDPLGAKDALRAQASIASLTEYNNSVQFGKDVLSAQDQALGQGVNILTRAEEIATQFAQDLTGNRASGLEEVHGLLQALTTLGNTEFAGRRLYSNLALNAPPPFADPNTPGYDPSTAFTGSTEEFSIKVGSSAGERVQISTQGDTVFTSSLQALFDLQTALSSPAGDVKGTLAALTSARDTLDTARASVGAREAQLNDQATLISGSTALEQGTLSRVKDADMISVISQLTQVQNALQATLQAGIQIAQTSLVNLIKL